MNLTWGKPQISFIRENAGKLKDDELTAALNQKFDENYTVAAVKKKRQRMKIAKEPGRGICETVKRRKSL